MKLNNLLIDLLLKFYEENETSLNEDVVFEAFNTSKEALRKTSHFNMLFYFHNEMIKLRSNLKIGYIQKRKTVDFLISKDIDTRLVYKALAFDGDLVLMDLANEKILAYLKRSKTHLIATVEFSKKNKPYFILDNEPLYHLELTSDAPLIKGLLYLF